MNYFRAGIRSIKIQYWLILTSLLFGFLFLVKPVSAAVRCETQYGGTQVCITTGQIQVNKEIFDPQNKKFVDNLGINDFKFSPGELLSFRISVKNVGDATLSKVTVTDTPQEGFLDLATGALNFDLSDLKPGETRQQELKFRVVDESKLPQNNVICIINAAEAAADNSRDRDTTQLCLERKVAPPVETKQLPKTGPEGWLLTLFSSVAGLIAGTRLVRAGRMHYETVKNDFQMTENRIIKKGRE